MQFVGYKLDYTAIKFMATEQLSLRMEAKNCRDPSKKQKSDWQTVSADTIKTCLGVSPVTRTVYRGVVIFLPEETNSKCL